MSNAIKSTHAGMAKQSPFRAKIPKKLPTSPHQCLRRYTYQDRNMRVLIIVATNLMLLTGCASTYSPPQEENTNYVSSYQGSKHKIFANAQRVLLLEGFQIQSSNDQAGYISTSLKNWKLSPAQANCGTTMGIDYLKDKRTKTEVAFNIVVDDNYLSIRSNIQGEYKPGAVDQDITLTCISRGVIESELATNILQ